MPSIKRFVIKSLQLGGLWAKLPNAKEDTSQLARRSPDTELSQTGNELWKEGDPACELVLTLFVSTCNGPF